MGGSEGSVARLRIEEVILENFMSHAYSRVRFGPGLNVITGPNGAGKSSILLGLSVALGQTYTERGERLSDLIRRGEEAARVSVVLDNSPVDGIRPIKSIDSDKVVITRYVKSNGEYWHYVNNKFRTKAEVEHLLRGVGLNPNNMLIIMHQNMIEQFTAKDNVAKLQMVEDAVGILQLRTRILNAEARLRSLESEESSVKKMLEEAKVAVNYWKEEMEKVNKLRSLQMAREQVELQYLWSLVDQVESVIEKKRSSLERLQKKIEVLSQRIAEASIQCEELRGKILSSLESGSQAAEVIEMVDRLVDRSVERAIFEYERESAEREAKELERELMKLEGEREERVRAATSKGEKVRAVKQPEELLDELRLLTLQIASLGPVTSEAESMYLLADSKFAELLKRAKELEENVKRAREELEHRKEVWKAKLRELVSKVEPIYQEILGTIGASGYIRLRNLEEMSKASLELYVGFRGAVPTLLDAQTHSGGERIVGTLAFLLALQSSVKSPFRAIDEFDVHLDPINREVMIKMILEIVRRNPGTQYVVITPGAVPVVPEMNLIIVQNVSERSFVTVKEEVAS